MKPEDLLLITCARQDFQEKQKSQVQELAQRYPINWKKVFATSEKHGIAPLIYANLILNQSVSLGIPEEVIRQFRLYAYRNTITKAEQAQKLENSLAYFHRHSIPVMLVKGAALDRLVYDQPWYTELADFDLIIRPKSSELPARLIQEIHDLFSTAGIEYDYYEHHDLNMNGALPVDFKSIWDSARQFDYRGICVYVPSPEDLLISVCINSCRKRFFRLKSLCDIHETLRKFPEFDWELFVKKTRQYDCQNIAYTALLINDTTMGSQVPAQVYRQLKVGALRAFTIRAVIYLLKGWTSLSSYPTGGLNLLGRSFHLSLLLPYLTYQGYQARRKMVRVIGEQAP